MNKLLSFEFLYQARQYYALAHVRETQEGNLYKITVMDREIEKLIQGRNTIQEIQGQIEVCKEPDTEIDKIIHSISKALILRTRSENSPNHLN